VRLAELERAKNRIQENQASLYGSVEIKSNPAAVSIWVGREEIGTTPAEYNLLIPGDVKITMRKEGYIQWDTAFKVAPGAKLKLNVQLNEKSIFSQEGELEFSKLLSKDTIIQGYLSRIEVIKARKAQVAEELKQILADFSNKYPALEPQKADETLESFNKRKEAWTREGMRQYTELQKKAQNYNDKLDRSLQVLNDHIVGVQSSVLNEMLMAPKVELGAYDAEKETFEITAEDTANTRSPFAFKGKVGVPLNTAKTLNRSAPGFAGVLHFINYPFGTGSEDVNLAMSKLQLSKDGQDLKTEGVFSEIERYKSVEGYNVWKVRADSILSGTLKSQGLDYNYAMGRAAAKDAAEQAEKKEGSGGLGWRGWTRIVTIPAALALGTLGVLKNNDVKDKKKDAEYYEGLYNTALNAPGGADTKELDRSREDHAAKKKEFDDAKTQRNIFFGAAGGCAFVAILTFVF
jgi:Skp family chaperone for outer membrane proteins